MEDFYLKKYEEADNPKLTFYKVYRSGKCDYDEFIENLNGKYKSLREELGAIHAIIDKIGIIQLPPSKFRNIKGGKNDRKDIWEIKSKHLRVYLIRKEPDMFLLLGGIKTKQEEDIATVFRRYNLLPEDMNILDEDGKVIIAVEPPD
ncbi:MAG: hypothetical protein K2M13_04525 [Muribaculaceae bacterium]|nr:hypothetical protein [Muribaculaceae bacterium]